MTTIVYSHKEGVIAFESRLSCGSLIETDEDEKSLTIGDDILILSGAVSEIYKFKENWPDLEKCGKATGFMIRDKSVFVIRYSEEMVLVVPCNYDSCDGSGADHAITALDMGATAEEAVKMAIKRDIYSGGEVKSIKVRG